MAYTIQQSVEDGGHIDISKTKEVAEQGFKCPVYITSGVQEILSDIEVEGQSYQGRLWDMLLMAKIEIKRMQREQDHFGVFHVLFAEQTKKQLSVKLRKVKLFVSFNSYVGFSFMLPEEY